MTALEQGRASFSAGSWADAYAGLAGADRDVPLGPEDLDRLAAAAYLTGRPDESCDAWVRAHHGFLDRSEPERAARCGFWIAFTLGNGGEYARAGGWLSRAQRLLADGPDCAERGYLLYLEALRSIFGGDDVTAHATFRDAASWGERFGDPDLVALARHGQGRALLRMGRVEPGLTLLDEAMAAVDAGSISPILSGDIYCSVLEACHEVFDLRRAQEWTSALTRWCEAQPDLVPYRGQCAVRRAEVLQLRGAWPDALREARRACEWLLRPPPQRAAGAAYYREAELHRLRGDFVGAEEAYRKATQWGRTPQPGLALLRLGQGHADLASAAIRRAVDEARDRRRRAGLLAAYVDIMLAVGDVDAARAAAGELADIAGELDATVLRAHADQADGAVRLAAGDAQGALEPLRRAWTTWQELEAPHGRARARVLIACACRALGDEDTARLELEAARGAFAELGAAPDIAHVDALLGTEEPTRAGGLTARELQVLRLVAAGKTNRTIAGELFISIRTVDRHVSNILTKLGLSSRAAATAYAYENGLI